MTELEQLKNPIILIHALIVGVGLHLLILSSVLGILRQSKMHDSIKLILYLKTKYAQN